MKYFLSQRLLAMSLLLSLAGCIPPFNQDDPPSFSEPLREFEVDNIRYVASGDPLKPLVFLLHGTPGSWHAFRHLLEDEQLQNRAHLVAPDRPGFGASSAAGLAASFQDQVALLKPALERNRSGLRAVVVGHSLGGSIAYRYAIDAPDQVGGIVVISSNIDPELGQPRWFNRLASLPGIRWLLPNQLSLANREIEPLRAELEDMEDQLSAITAMITVLHGAGDRLVSVDNLDYLERKLGTESDAKPDTKLGADLGTDLAHKLTYQLIRAEDQGHFLIWERPDLVRQAILQQLTALEEEAQPASLLHPQEEHPQKEQAQQEQAQIH
jgi:pimeloyl-ACP methyl ester carboxylesterase